MCGDEKSLADIILVLVSHPSSHLSDARIIFQPYSRWIDVVSHPSSHLSDLWLVP